MGATLHACLHAAVWGNLASRTSSSPPSTRTAVSVLVTPAARLSVRRWRQRVRSNLEFFSIIQFDWNLIIQLSQPYGFIWKHFIVSRSARCGVTFKRVVPLQMLIRRFDCEDFFLNLSCCYFCPGLCLFSNLRHLFLCCQEKKKNHILSLHL